MIRYIFIRAEIFAVTTADDQSKAHRAILNTASADPPCDANSAHAYPVTLVTAMTWYDHLNSCDIRYRTCS